MGLFAVLLITAAAARGARAGEGKVAPRMKVRFLLQGQAQFTQDGNPAKDALGTEFFIRRARVILAGKINKWIHFFYETDNPNFGKNGSWDSAFFTQDAFVDFRMYREFKVAAGMILLPFTHHNRQSAASLNTLDYNNMFSGKFIADKVWRDVGIEARGIVIDKIDYRIGVFNGLRGASAIKGADATNFKLLNPNDLPRVTGRLAFNFFEPETSFFYGGTYLGGKKVLALGFGFDIQPDATLDDKGNLKTYQAFAGDLYWDIPLTDEMELTGQLGYVFFDRGNAQDVDKFSDDTSSVDEYLGSPVATYKDSYTPSAGTGMGCYGDVGFRYGMFQPTIAGKWFDSDKKGADYQDIRGGVNMYIKGHNSNLKLEYALVTAGTWDAATAKEGSKSYSQVTLQTQFLF